MPAVFSLFGALIVVVLTARLNTRAVIGQIEARGELRGEIGELRGEINALRAETKQSFAELRLEVHERLSALERRIEQFPFTFHHIIERVSTPSTR